MAAFAQSTATRAEMTERVQDLLDTAFLPVNALLQSLGVWSKSQIAEHLAGTADKKNKTYKAALRNIERWTTSAVEKRKPGKASLQKLVAALKTDRQALTQQFSAGVQLRLDGVIAVGDDPKYSRRRTGVVVNFSPARGLICCCTRKMTRMRPGKIFLMCM